MFLNESNDADAPAYLDYSRGNDDYVANFDRAWAWRPDVARAFIALRMKLMENSTLTQRELAVLVCTAARVVGDAYCSWAWGSKLAVLAGPAFAADVLRGSDVPELTTREAALKRWAEQVVRDPNGTSARDVDALRGAGLDDREIFEATAFVAFRLAFSTINDALGARPDRHVVDTAPPELRAAITYGRPPPD